MYHLIFPKAMPSLKLVNTECGSSMVTKSELRSRHTRHWLSTAFDLRKVPRLPLRLPRRTIWPPSWLSKMREVRNTNSSEKPLLDNSPRARTISSSTVAVAAMARSKLCKSLCSANSSCCSTSTENDTKQGFGGWGTGLDRSGGLMAVDMAVEAAGCAGGAGGILWGCGFVRWTFFCFTTLATKCVNSAWSTSVAILESGVNVSARRAGSKVAYDLEIPSC